ncbi:MAG: GNAT family N-acetyltransferase [Myxococcota bacterium]|nr:GNAT family N-acetyltransferase [Myxococcota bacterium]
MQLATDRLILRELAESDAQRLFEIESAPDFGRYLERYSQSVEEAAEYLRGSVAATQLVPRLVYDFAVVREDVMIGRAGMKRGETEPRMAMLWYAIDPAHQGHGYATEAAHAVLRFAFEELELHRVWADADPRNAASVRVMERLGMRREAHHLENICIRGEWCGSVICAMLKREWPT